MTQVYQLKAYLSDKHGKFQIEHDFSYYLMIEFIADLIKMIRPNTILSKTCIKIIIQKIIDRIDKIKEEDINSIIIDKIFP